MLVLIGKLTPMGVGVMIVLFAVIIGASIIQLDDEISNSKDGPWKSVPKEDLQQMLAGSDIEIK